jgi:hypothetical protein
VGVPADVRHSQRRTNTPVQHCQHCRSAAVASSTMHHLLCVSPCLHSLLHERCSPADQIQCWICMHRWSSTCSC